MDLTTILEKLEPLLVDDVARWRRTLPLVDEQTRTLLVKQIITTAQRLLPDLERRFLLPPPPANRCGGEIVLGTVIYDRELQEFGLSRNELLPNLVLLGRSGAGKSNAVLQLLRQLSELGVAWTLLDWKRNGRDLLPLLEERVNVFTPGRSLAPLQFNPFIPPPGVERHVHVTTVVDLMADAYTLGDGSKSLLQKALYTLTERRGATNVAEVMETIESYDVRGRAQGWKASALRALQTLQFSQLWDATEQDQQALVQRLLGEPTIIELDSLGENARKFLIPLLTLFLFHTRMQSPDREQLRNVLVLEEAHHVLSARSEGVMERILRQCRELGMAMVIVDQTPSLISSTVLGNCATSIILNLKDPSDVRRAAALSLVPDSEAWGFSTLPLGHAVVKTQVRPGVSRPFVVRIPQLALEKGSMTDHRLLAYLTATEGRSRQNRGSSTVGASLPDFPVPEGVLEPSVLSFLLDCLQHPDQGVSARYERLGLSAHAGNTHKTMMLSSGLVEEQRVFDGRTTKTLLRPTRKARELFDLDTTEPSTASLAHSYWIRHWERRLQEAGYTVIREHPRAGGNADLFAGKPQNGRESPNELVVEVETGKSDVVANVLNDLRSGFNPVVVVATDDDALRIVERQLAEAGLLIPGRVQLALRERLPKTWRCSALDHQHNAH